MPPKASYGRGGAGNIASPNLHPQPSLTTPTIKTDTYTTGRGGTGNMAKNDPSDPFLARKAQDVEEAPRRLSSSGYVGRGGEGNTVRNVEEAMEEEREREKEGREGVVEKAKELLGKK